MTQIFCHYHDDHSFVFKRGVDTVHVTVATRSQRSARAVRHISYLIAVGFSLFLGFVFLPLLIIFPFVVLAWYGWTSTYRQGLYEQAEMEARKQFDRMEAERWAAMRSFKG